LIILHIGSNLGNPIANLAKATWLIESFATIKKQSAIYRTAAWGVEDQPDFANQAIWIETDLSPMKVLDSIQSIEAQMGRKRVKRWGTRIIDIDMLTYNDQIIDTERLQLPHPRLAIRKFVLVPLHDIAPHWRHPQLEKTTTELLENCEDPLNVEPWVV